jgi:hypothetical protein
MYKTALPLLAAVHLPDARLPREMTDMSIVFWLMLINPAVVHVGTFSSMDACKKEADSIEVGQYNTTSAGWHPIGGWNVGEAVFCIQANDSATKPPD